MMEIRRYIEADQPALFQLLAGDGADWAEYSQLKKPQYMEALRHSITYVVIDEGLRGYCRCRDDDGFGIYIYDLLVEKNYRGNQAGHALMSQIKQDFPEVAVYVMSDVDPYYEKIGYTRIGSVFEVTGA
ncbi:GNAT family N-acetyltransferase [Enterococcus canis]|nr:GNAT family N-acetyltransferase [Enterococcus canis]